MHSNYTAKRLHDADAFDECMDLFIILEYEAILAALQKN